VNVSVSVWIEGPRGCVCVCFLRNSNNLLLNSTTPTTLTNKTNQNNTGRAGRLQRRRRHEPLAYSRGAHARGGRGGAAEIRQRAASDGTLSSSLFCRRCRAVCRSHTSHVLFTVFVIAHTHTPVPPFLCPFIQRTTTTTQHQTHHHPSPTHSFIPPHPTTTTITITKKVDEMAAGDLGYGFFRLFNRVAQTALLGGVLALGACGVVWCGVNWRRSSGVPVCVIVCEWDERIRVWFRVCVFAG
jgi:hypothetical protein